MARHIPDVTETLWVYCPKCATLFLDVRGKYLLHECGPRIGQVILGNLVERPRKLRKQLTRLARRVVRP